jgi:hypothetical protein
MAGCVEDPNVSIPNSVASDAPTNLVRDGRDLRKDLKETDVIEAPEWKVGDWFGHHVFFEGGPEAGLHINTIVVKEQGDSWFLATDDKQMAKLESVFDIPIIGPVSKKDLSATGFGSAWEPYVFPLKQGATWTRKVMTGDQFGGSEEISVKYEVVYNPRISTPDGDRPGFDIFGKVDGGKVLYAYDFVPDIQWYAHFYEYNLDTEQPEDYDFHVMSMGHGAAWTGTYYIDEARPVVQEHHGYFVDPTDPAGAYVDPEPYIPFTVDDKATYVYGFAFSVAFMGVQETLIVDPQNNRHEFQAVATSEEEATEVSGELDLPAQAGEWKAVGVGAGGAAIWGVFLWQVTETAATL